MSQSLDQLLKGHQEVTAILTDSGFGDWRISDGSSDVTGGDGQVSRRYYTSSNGEYLNIEKYEN